MQALSLPLKMQSVNNCLFLPLPSDHSIVFFPETLEPSAQSHTHTEADNLVSLFENRTLIAIKKFRLRLLFIIQRMTYFAVFCV